MKRAMLTATAIILTLRPNRPLPVDPPAPAPYCTKTVGCAGHRWSTAAFAEDLSRTRSRFPLLKEGVTGQRAGSQTPVTNISWSPH